MGMERDELKERIRAATDLVAVVREHVDLTPRSGSRDLWGPCPFHEETKASFHVVPDKQLWKCFGCGLGGDVFEFVMRIGKLDFPTTLKLLADRAGIVLPERGQADGKPKKKPRKPRPDKGAPMIEPIEGTWPGYDGLWHAQFPGRPEHLVKHRTSGAWQCDCEAWGFGKLCRHVRAVCELRGEPLPRSPKSRESSDQNTGTARAPASAALMIDALAAATGRDADLMRKWRVYEERGMVMIPYFMADGTRAPRTRIRSALAAGDGSRWSGKSEDGEIVPYGLDKLDMARKAGYVILVEGESDCWTLWSHNFPALGVPGAQMVEKLSLEMLEGIGRVYVVHESDRGGDAFVLGVAARLWELQYPGEAFVVDCQPTKDPNELMLSCRPIRDPDSDER